MVAAHKTNRIKRDELSKGGRKYNSVYLIVQGGVEESRNQQVLLEKGRKKQTRRP